MGKVCDDRCKNEQEREGRIFRESRKSRNGLRPRPDMPDIPGAMRSETGTNLKI